MLGCNHCSRGHTVKWPGPTDPLAPRLSTVSGSSSREATMYSPRSEQMTTIAGSGHDRPSALLHSSSAAAGTYGCEKRHKRLIVAGNKRQNENKSSWEKEIGQNKKKIGGGHVPGPPSSSANPRVSERKRAISIGRAEPKLSPNRPQQRPNGASSAPMDGKGRG